MPLKIILKHPDDQLLEVSKPLTDEEIRSDETQRLIEDMIETMKAENGVGLAAPQVGVQKRIFVAETKSGTEVYVNPKIISRSNKMADGTEGCLSVPDVWGIVERHKSVKVKAKNRNGEPVRFKASGLMSVICQHEIDHLDGILFIDRAKKILEGEDRLGEAVI
ncbi:MAG: peptide deformylase [bacterium]